MNQSLQPKIKHTNPFYFALELGFFAGIIWGAVRLLFYALHFTKVIPGFLAEPFFKHDFLISSAGHMIGYLFFILLSMMVSLLYVLVFRKLKGPWPGMLYGVMWWAIIFLGGSWLFLQQPPFRMSWNTAISEFCVFLLWGLFIGYTSAIEYTDERARDDRVKPA